MQRNFILLPLIFICIVSEFYCQEKKKNLGPNINTTDLTESNGMISPDGKAFYFTRFVPGKNWLLYQSKLGANNVWEPATPINELNNDSIDYIHYIYPDGKKMIVSGESGIKSGYFETSFVNNKWTKSVAIFIEFESGSYQWQLYPRIFNSDKKVMLISNYEKSYVSFLKKENKWSAPVEISCLKAPTGWNVSFFLAQDDTTLYFSGDGYKTPGGMDVFKTTRLDDTWLNWSKPEALDETVNSKNYETDFKIGPDGKSAYLYMLEEGNGDLFSVQLTDNNKPTPFSSVKVEIGQTIVLENIFFTPNKYDLLPESYTELDQLVKTMKENPKMTIEVSGHTSKNDQGAEFNKELSANRALSVKNYLIQNGIDANRISSKGYGYDKPLFTDTDEEHQQKNRRVEFSVLSK
ncbi:MAG: OmpA family protein [Bacteroidia bacterium]|nr:OmpA family protein [Bacteroidia bacterium]